MKADRQVVVTKQKVVVLAMTDTEAHDLGTLCIFHSTVPQFLLERNLIHPEERDSLDDLMVRVFTALHEAQTEKE